MNQTEIDELRRLHEADSAKIINAMANIDWQQHLMNAGGCFHVEDDGRLCGRADRWSGHGEPDFHMFVPLYVAATKLAKGNALPRLIAALEEARAERDKANGLVKRMEHDNRVIARELDCSWGGSANPEHECKEDNPCLARQYQDAEERLEATATFLERATTRQCYLAKQAAEAERDALKAKLAALVEEMERIKDIMGGHDGCQGWDSPEDVWGIADKALAAAKVQP